MTVMVTFHYSLEHEYKLKKYEQRKEISTYQKNQHHQPDQ